MEAFIVEAVRTPVARRGGGLAGVHPADLGAAVLTALVSRAGIDPAAVEDVIFGCVDTVGPQAGDIARTAWLAAGLPDHVPGTTVDRQCGSSQQAVHFAAQAVLAGTADVVVAGGVQHMTAVPISYAMTAGRPLGFTDPFSGSAGWRARYGDAEVSQFRAAEMIAAKWSVSRAAMEAFAVRSHERAIAARAEGRFAREIEPVAGVTADEGLREHGLTPRARVHHLSVLGADPLWMLTAPIPATARALAKTGLTMDDIDLVEINEAFAPVVLAWLAETGADPARVNVNGGAIALGHPLGATGARLMTTLLHELERRGARYGLQTMCEGGGQANVTIIERL
jgi:acetyl-CoA C-acetyltransferase